MNDQEALDMLYDEHRDLEKAIGDIEYQIKDRLPWMKANHQPERIASYLQERYGAQRLQIYRLGKVAGHIEELERRVRDRETDRKNTTALDWLDAIEPRATHKEESQLDWFDQQPAEPAREQPVPNRVPPDAERERTGEELLAWLPGRGNLFRG